MILKDVGSGIQQTADVGTFSTIEVVLDAADIYFLINMFKIINFCLKPEMGHKSSLVDVGNELLRGFNFWTSQDKTALTSGYNQPVK